MPLDNAAPLVSPTWRQRAKIHPAADLLPLMAESELELLAEDIKKYGLLEPVVCLENGTLLDGRNRLDAMERAGLPVFDDDGNLLAELRADVAVADPYAYVVSANYHRRQLTPEQMHDLILMYKEKSPTSSVRSIAHAIRTSKSKVARVLKARGVPSGTPEERVDGRDGKRYPAKKTSPAKSRVPKAQVRCKAIEDFAGLLSRQTRETLEDLGKLLEDQRAKITAEPLDRRRAWARTYMRALDVEVNDLQSEETSL